VRIWRGESVYGSGRRLAIVNQNRQAGLCFWTAMPTATGISRQFVRG